MGCEAARRRSPRSPARPGRGDTVPVDPGAAALDAQLQAAVAAAPSVVQVRTAAGSAPASCSTTIGNDVVTKRTWREAETAKVDPQRPSTHNATSGSFASVDVAVVHIKDATPPPAVFADSSALRLGQIVLAMGSPLGLRGSVTQGIVSALNRVEEESSSVLLGGMIQTSAPIFPGNSGGALLDLRGAVVGLPTLGADQAGIGFAIPSNTVVAIGRQLAADGRVTHSGLAWIGLLAAPVRHGGLRILRVAPGSSAAKAGIRRHSKLLAIDGRRVATTIGVKRLLLTAAPVTRSR